MAVEESFTTNGVQWQARPECRDALFGPAGMRLDEWLQNGAAQVVKHGPHRTVYRVRLPDLDCHIKHYRIMNLRAWLRELVRPAKALTEYRQAHAVAARQVPTAEPLAAGRQIAKLGGPGESFLITRTLENTVALGSYLETVLPTLPSVRQTRLRQSLALALGEFLARMHAGGIVHHDLHPGNILLRLGPNDEVTLFLIDLHAVSVGTPLSWPARSASLVLLNRYFSLRASRSDRLRSWRVYCEQMASGGRQSPESGASLSPELPNSGDCRPPLARRIECDTLRSNLHFWKQRDERSLATNRYYQKVRRRGVMGHAVRDLDRSTLDQFLADPDAPFRSPGVMLLKDSRSSTVAELEIPGPDGPRRVIYKRFRVVSWSDPWAAVARRSPALRSWVFGHGLRERCLPTARPLAVFHRVRRGMVCEGYLLTEKLPAALDLKEWVAQLQSLPEAERRPLLLRRLEEVARLVRDLHGRRLSHRDLKATNLLISDDRVWFIDLVGVSRSQRSHRRRVQNLARLAASFRQEPLLSRSDKLRFLWIYRRVGLVGKGNWKMWWRHIESAMLSKVERNRRNGRPLT